MDSSHKAEQAAYWAAEHVRPCGGDVRLLSALPARARVVGPVLVPPAYAPHEAEQAARELLLPVQRQVARMAPDVPVQLAFSPASPADAWAGPPATPTSWSSAPTQQARSSGFSGGSVSRHLAGRLRTPVVAGRRGGGRRGPVVVGIDGSAGSRAAALFAGQEAALRGVGLVAARVWAPSRRTDGADAAFCDEVDLAREAEALVALDAGTVLVRSLHPQLPLALVPPAA
ncbi:universal stress protein [Motilibacter aurantiacus]|uniref:universal stress protein n=1 Tax=Motilibacter aurantiacus TaxID=2714955 RepID=UPI001407BD2D|nr:hypothetical protein [Motilibacter aurantiacus]